MSLINLSKDIFFKNYSIEYYKPANIHCFNMDKQFIYNSSYGYIENLIKYTPVEIKGDILILGLGMGVMPAYFSNERNIRIEVIEKDPEIISNICSNEIIDCSEILIMQADALKINLNNQYDYIISDIHYNINDQYYHEKEIILDKYSNNIKEGGVLYFHLDSQFFQFN